MSWVRLDDGLDDNPKQLSLSDSAFRVWVCSWAFCARQRPLTGYLSDEQARSLLRKLRKRQSVIAELVRRRGWERVSDGYLVHDFEEYVVRTARDRTADWRARKRAQDGDAAVTGTASHVVTSASQDVTDGDALRARGVPVPVPEPVPVTSESSGTRTARTPPTPPAGGDVRSSSPTTTGPPLSPEAVELLTGYADLVGHVHSGTDAIKAQEFVGELRYLTPAEMVERMRQHVEWCRRERKHPPRTLGGFWNSLRSENDHRASNGTAQRSGSSGLTRLGDMLPADVRAASRTAAEP